MVEREETAFYVRTPLSIGLGLIFIKEYKSFIHNIDKDSFFVEGQKIRQEMLTIRNNVIIEF